MVIKFPKKNNFEEKNEDSTILEETGDLTKNILNIAALGHYIIHNPPRAKRILDLLHRQIQKEFSVQGKSSYFLVIRGDGKINITLNDPEKDRFYLSNPVKKNEFLDPIMVLMSTRYNDEKTAKFFFDITQQIKKQAGLEGQIINLPEMILLERDIVANWIRGPDLFDFFLELNNKSNTIAKKALRDAIIDTQQEYGIFVKKIEYGFSDEDLIYPDYTEKMIEFYKDLGITLNKNKKKKIRELTEHLTLNRFNMHPVADIIPYNFKIKTEAAETFLDNNFINLKADYQNIYDMCQVILKKNIVFLDPYDVMKRAFPEEDLFLTRIQHHPLSHNLIKKYELRYIEKLKRAGMYNKSFGNYKGIKEWIKFSRWARIHKFHFNFPDPQGIYFQDNIKQAHIGLFQFVHKKTPPPEEVQNITPKKTLNELVMHPNCRP